MRKPGRLIVLEGIDGSGKSTHFQWLCRNLIQKKIPFQQLTFPQYQELSSTLVRMYLKSAFGAHPGDVNPYAASTFYAVDRYAAWKQKWGGWYQTGQLILSERYTTSNMVHQGSKLPPEERTAFFDWLSDFEYRKMGLPEPDLVVYLDIPVEMALQLLRAREAAAHTTGDIHETDTAYLTRCHETAQSAVQYGHWKTISCVDADGRLRSESAVQQNIWKAIQAYL